MSSISTRSLWDHCERGARFRNASTPQNCCSRMRIRMRIATSDRSGPSFRKIRVRWWFWVSGSPSRSFLILRLATSTAALWSACPHRDQLGLIGPIVQGSERADCPFLRTVLGGTVRTNLGVTSNRGTWIRIGRTAGNPWPTANENDQWHHPGTSYGLERWGASTLKAAPNDDNGNG